MESVNLLTDERIDAIMAEHARITDDNLRGAVYMMLRDTEHEVSKTLRADSVVAAHAKRLAMELECLLMDTKDLAVVSRWWASAHEAIGQYQDDIDQLYPQRHVEGIGHE